MAPMAGAMDAELAAEVSQAGGLGSLPCAMLTPAQLRDQFAKIRARTGKPVNLNFFCHRRERMRSCSRVVGPLLALR
jgi:nitronate monooxygenase